MAYATKDDLRAVLREKRIVELTTDSGETPDDAMVTDILDRVSSEMDGYLLTYKPPITDTTVKGILCEHALKIAVYRLFLRGLLSGDALDDAKGAADRSYDWLELVAKGTIGLPVVLVQPVIPDAESFTTAGSDEPMFDKDPGNVL